MDLALLTEILGADADAICKTEFLEKAGRDDWVSVIRELIQPLHDLTEQTPFAKGLIAGQLDQGSYIELLQQSYLIHQGVEQALASQPALRQLFKPGMQRVEALLSDLDAFGAGFAEPWAVVKDFLTELDQIRVSNPIGLLGYLYVLEGSRMGSMILLPLTARALGRAPVPGNGLDYHLLGAGETPARFRGFKRGLQESVGNPRDRVLVLLCARSMMRTQFELYSRLLAPQELTIGAQRRVS